jgi:hypothetical protein
MPIDRESPAGRLLTKTKELLQPIPSILTEENPGEFDRKFTEIEAGILEWNTLFQAVRSSEDTQQLEAATNIAILMVKVLSSVKARSEEIGATKGRKVDISAAAAGGKRRKMTRKYCKKTTCRKMGFSQKASCRPYKNCFTRRTKH